MKNTATTASNLCKTFFLVLFVLLPALAGAQSFNDGLKLYQQGKYEQAADIFTQLKTDKANLFAGKSYFASGKYLTAKAYLGSIPASATPDIYQETQYTLALTDFQLGLFGNVLNRVYRMRQNEVQTQVVTNAIQLYRDVLHYLTLNQRRKAFQEAQYPEIKYDLVEAAFGNVSYPVAKTLFAQLKKSKIDTSSTGMQKLSDMIADSMRYAVRIAYNNQLRAPDGMTYNIGAALPKYNNSEPEFEVSQGLYFGYVLAAEEFNQQHSDKKAFIRNGNTAASKDSAKYVMTDFAWNYNVDAVLGPLFSGPAEQMASLAEKYQIPMLAPLANSDTLNTDNPYVYQANPTFVSHGKKMADYAVNTLHMDTLAVLAEKNSLGEASAFAFREEAEKLGARVVYFFVDNLQAKGYDLTDYTKYFTTDQAKIDSSKFHQLDAVYAPFTGQASATLAELLLVDLKAMGSDLTILGSQEWGNINIPENQLGNRTIYFSESYYVDRNSPEVERFEKQFKKRFDMEPNRFAMIGYDAASFLLKTIDRIANPELLKNALKKQPLYEGLASNIYFDGSHINQEVKIFKITADQGTVPVLK